MSADLNYTLKRLMRGLCSENHSVKQGFFLASVLVLSKFKGQVDFEKYFKFLFNETKTSNAMKSSEANNMAMGRMMTVSACVESKVFGAGQSINAKILKIIVDCLVEIYDHHDFLQESVSAIFSKILAATRDNK